MKKLKSKTLGNFPKVVSGRVEIILIQDFIIFEANQLDRKHKGLKQKKKK